MASFFAERLKDLREGKGLSQRELADQAGVSYGAVRHYEQGTRNPTWDVVLKLCDVLGAKCSDFAPEGE